MPGTANDDDDDSPRGDLFSQRSMQVASYVAAGGPSRVCGYIPYRQ